MQNQVSFKALVQLNPERAISSTGKSARGTLAGVGPDGAAFFIPALFIGEALTKVKAYLESNTEKPLIAEGTGSFTMDRYQRNDGERVFEALLKVDQVKSLRSNLKTIAAPNGSLRLAKGHMSTVFEGVVVADPRPAHEEFGQKLLLKEDSGDRRSAYVFVRVPTGQTITCFKGDVLSVEGRVTRLRPHGKDKPRETGIVATGVRPVAASAPTVAPQAEEVQENELPF